MAKGHTSAATVDLRPLQLHISNPFAIMIRVCGLVADLPLPSCKYTGEHLENMLIRTAYANISLYLIGCPSTTNNFTFVYTCGC